MKRLKFGFLIIGFSFYIVLAQQVSAPTNFNVSAPSACIIKLDWQYSGSAGSFEIWRDTINTFTSPNLSSTTVSGSLRSYEDENLPPNTTYYYQMRAWSNNSNSTWTDTKSATTLSLTAKQPPNILKAFGRDNGLQVYLEWSSQAISQYGGFEISRATSTDGNNFSNYTVIEPNLPSNLNFYVDNNLDPNLVYKYRLRSYESDRGCGQTKVYSNYSNEVIIPKKPINLKVSYIYNPNIPLSEQKIDLSWEHNGIKDFYEIWRKVDSGDFSYSTSSTNKNYTDKDVSANKKYTYKVRACVNSSIVSCSDYSNEDWRVVASAPQNFKAWISSISGSVINVSLKWDNTFPERDYFLERATSSRQFVQIKSITAKPSSVLSVSATDNVSFGQTYIYRVRSKFGDVFTDYSVEQTIEGQITPIKGWAWIGGGLGWIRLSNDSVKSSWGNANTTAAPTENIAYTVYVENNTKKLGGYAWSPYAGWLSFNEQDLGGCPSGLCRAEINPDGSVSGWAKFIKNEQGQGLDKWVSLSVKPGEPNSPYPYELYYATSTEGGVIVGELRGFAWASDIGWISFGGPILKKVENIDTLDPTNKRQVKLIWDNPSNYKKVQILRKGPGDPDFFSIETFDQNNQSQNINQGKDKNYIDTGLEPNAFYEYFIRGDL